MGRSKITGTGLEHLIALHELEILRLQSCGFSDAGVKYVKALPKIRVLRLGACDLSPEAERELRDWRPTLRIYLTRRR